MSFESGFNTGANIAASLRSSANQRRSLDLQEKRDEVNKLATEQLIAKRATDMKNAETVRKRLTTNAYPVRLCLVILAQKQEAEV